MLIDDADNRRKKGKTRLSTCEYLHVNAMCSRDRGPGQTRVLSLHVSLDSLSANL